MVWIIAKKVQNDLIDLAYESNLFPETHKPLSIVFCILILDCILRHQCLTVYQILTFGCRSETTFGE